MTLHWFQTLKHADFQWMLILRKILFIMQESIQQLVSQGVVFTDDYEYVQLPLTREWHRVSWSYSMKRFTSQHIPTDMMLQQLSY